MKPKYDNLKDAPILEAQIIFHFSDDNDLSQINAVTEKLKHKYPERKERFNLTQTIAFDGKPPKQATQELVGFQFLSEDKKRTLFYQKENLIISELGDYHSWDSLISSIAEIIPLLSMNGKTIKQISARYINRIEIAPPFDPIEYFTFFPNVNLKYHQTSLVDSTIKLNFTENQQLNANITFFQKSKKLNKKGKIEFILDIAASKQTEEKLENYSLLQTDLNQLRDFKNDIFFSLITDKLLEEYK